MKFLRITSIAIVVLLLFACSKSDETNTKADMSKEQQEQFNNRYKVPPPSDRSKDQGF